MKGPQAGISRRVVEHEQLMHDAGENPTTGSFEKLLASIRERATFTEEENLDLAMLSVKRQLARPDMREWMDTRVGPGSYDGAAAEVAEWEKQVRER